VRGHLAYAFGVPRLKALYLSKLTTAGFRSQHWSADEVFIFMIVEAVGFAGASLGLSFRFRDFSDPSLCPAGEVESLTTGVTSNFLMFAFNGSTIS